MYSRKFTDIQIANIITGQYYNMEAIDGKNTLLIVGDEGRQEFFRIEIRFLNTEYIGCPLAFTNEYTFRVATEQEAAPIREYVNATETRKIPVYCIERGSSWMVPVFEGLPTERKAFTFFIAAWSVEITIYHKGDLEGLLKRYGID